MTRELSPCGTPSALGRHRQAGEKCEICIEAQRARSRERYDAVKAQQAAEKVRAEARRRNSEKVRVKDEGPDEMPLVTGDWRKDVYGSASAATEHTRQPPRLIDQRRILALQGNICLYCNIPIGTVIGRQGRPRSHRPRDTKVTLRRNWDHFVPYSYIARNPQANWVLACHICNLIKTARMFDTVEDAREVILAEREKRGYEPARQVLARLAGAEA